jgi:hypothetical protein
MLTSVNLNDKFAAEPSNVHDVWADRSLPAKRDALLAKRPQQFPQLSFREGLTSTQCTRVAASLAVNIRMRQA